MFTSSNKSQSSTNEADRPVFGVDIVALALQQSLLFQVDNLVPQDTAQSGDSSAIYFGTHNGDSVVVKIGRDPRRFQVEVAGLALFAKHGIPAPRTLAHTDNAVLLNKPITVQTVAPGRPLSQLPAGTEQLAVWEDAGRILKQIHAIPLEGFGKLEVVDRHLRGIHATLRAWLESHLPDLNYIEQHNFITPTETAAIRTVYEELAAQPAVPGSLLHSDIQGAHLFTDGQRVTAVIDVASAKSGDPLYDIAYAHYFTTPEQQAAFDHGYGPKALDSKVRKYYLLTAVSKVSYRHWKGFVHRLPAAIEKLAQAMEAVDIH